jgi:hypothetical protein
MAQGRPTKVISMIKWIRTSRLSIKKCLCYEACPPPANPPTLTPEASAMSHAPCTMHHAPCTPTPHTLNPTPKTPNP